MLSGTPEVEVLLATFNGSQFLREQIESILAQDFASLRVLARDDGSDDETPAILEEYAERFPSRFHVMPASAGTGHPKWNFLLLMKASTAEHVCFADQDDVWVPEKITLTMQAIRQLEAKHGRNIPLLVFTDVRVVNEKLETLLESQWKHHRCNPNRIDRFSRLLGQNVVTGCTTMLNRCLVEKALSMPMEAAMHDHWIALVASAFGKCASVPQQTVLYRQHRGNVLGAGEQRRINGASITQRKGQWQKRWQISEQQAAGMLRVYGHDMPRDKRALLEAFVRCGKSSNPLIRVITVLRHGFYVLGPRNNLAMLWHLWTMQPPETRNGPE